MEDQGDPWGADHGFAAGGDEENGMQVVKTKFEMPLKPILVRALRDFANHQPIVTRQKRSDCQWTVEVQLFNGELAPAHEDVPSDPSFVSSKHRRAVEAENEAIMQAFEFLRANHNIEVQDFSYIYMVAAAHEKAHVISLIYSLNYALDKAFFDWNSSISTMENLHAEYINEKDTHSKFREVCQKLGLLTKNASEAYTSLFEELKSTKNMGVPLLQMHAQCDADQAKEWTALGRLSGTELLSILLAELQLPKAKFKHIYMQNGTFIGRATLDLSKIDTFKGCGKSVFTGFYAYYPEWAETFAAFNAIHFLIEHLGLEILDLNHSRLQAIQQEVAELRELKDNFLVTAHGLIGSWGAMIDDTKQVLAWQDDSYHVAPLTPDYPGFVQKMRKCAEAIQRAEDENKKIYDAAVQLLASPMKLA